MINFSILAKIVIMVISCHSFMTYQKSLAEKGEIRIDDILKDYEAYSPPPKSKSPFKRKKRVFSGRKGRY
jgi:hypothetical protein